MEKEKVIERLKQLGYEYVEEKDTNSLEFTISKTEQSILNATNCVVLPNELQYIAIDRACAEFLKLKKAFDQLQEFDMEQFAKTVSMGDVSITLSSEDSPEHKFDTIIEYMLTGNEEDIIRCRKLVW
ncbi:MAG: hypothetical protein E7284_10205 [Lachnospiraceae bacterium]|nr:hypothetical protein [Lachnospiraceae bacterium]